MSRLPVPDDDSWVESTEGDLDPDLAEETGYQLSDSDWDAPRSAWGTTWRLIAVALVIVLLLSLVLPIVL